MKKVIGLLVSAFLMLGLMSTSALADAAKGQKYYLKYMKDASGLNGAKFATQHTQAEWKGIYEAGNLNNALIKECPKFKPTKEASLADIYDFLYEYAVDSGNTALCN